MSASSVFLDVNVPMYAAGREHRYRQPCIWVLRRVAEGRLDVAIDSEIVQEILYRYGELRRWDTAVTLATSLLDLVATVFPVRAEDVRLAVELFARYAPQEVKARDLIHVAVMRTHGLTRIISTDRHFDVIEGVERLDPAELWAREARGQESDV